jgi:hypothetical protein
MMKAALMIYIGLCLIGLAIAAPFAFAEDSAALGSTHGSLLESPLIVPEAELLRAAARADLTLELDWPINEEEN